MPVFSKNVISQVSGFDSPLITGELVWNQKSFWNLSLVENNVAVDLTTATVTAQIVRRTVSNLTDTRHGLVFDLGNYTPTPTPVELTISNLVPANGSFTITMDASVWDLVNSDPELIIDVNSPACFTGYIKLAFASAASTPAEDIFIFLMFLVRSDGIIVT